MSTKAVRIVAALCLTTGLAVTPLSAAWAGAGAHCGRETTEGRGEVIALRENCFAPTVLRVEPGTTVTFVNEDPIVHHVTGANIAWNSGKSLAPEHILEVTFEEEGLYPYSCFLHVGMTGVIAVGDANAAADGKATAALVGDRPEVSPAPPASPAAVSEPATGGAARSGWWLGGLIGLMLGTGLMAGARSVGRRTAP